MVWEIKKKKRRRKDKDKLPCLFRHQTVDLTQPHKRSLTVMELMPGPEETN